MQKKTDRRTFMAAAGATAATVALAGCSSGDDGDDGGNGSSGDASVPDEVDSYLSDNNANLYEGGAEDMTGEDSVSIDVGGGEGLAFDAPAVVVSTGTEVTWEWTGNGGAHNVVSADSSAASFDSGEQVDSDSETFSYTFESAGNSLYYCTPHQSVGMHGAVIVQE